MSNLALETKNITKSFYENVVLKDINFQVEKGEIHALCGENGAGKSTLMKIISGVHKQNSGEIFIDGNKSDFPDTLTAQKLGISIIHQEFNLIPFSTVMENIFLDRQPKTKFNNIDYKAMREKTKKLADKLDIKIDPDALVKDLSVAQQQMVEILKAISIEANIIIMDEPTAALSQNEVNALFKIMKQLKSENKSIIYISHRLNEIIEITDKITVLKDGYLMGTVTSKDASKDEIINMMVGREIDNIFPKRSDVALDESVIEARNILLKQGKKTVNFTAYKGEVLGISGLEGQGQRELIRTLYGLNKAISGELVLNGKSVSIKTPKDALKNSISFITDDRKSEGLCLEHPIYSNICLPILNVMKKLIFVTNKSEKNFSEQYMTSLNIKALSSNSLVKTLSGGNQQKVLLGKSLSNTPQILLVHEPTRGIDVSAKIEIYNLFHKLTKEQNITIIMVSSDLLEVINVSDRIIVMSDHTISGEVLGKDATEEILMSMAVAFEESGA